MALALPAVVLVMATVLGAGHVLVARIECVDAARAGARAAARAEQDAQVRADVRHLVPTAAVVVTHVGDVVRVEVSETVRLDGPVRVVPMSCAAVAVAEEP